MTTIALFGRDIYLRHTAVGGGSYVQCHRVWDAERFIAAQKKAAEALNMEAREKGIAAVTAKVEQITEVAYLAEKSR